MILGCDLYNIINHKLSSVCVYSSFHLIHQQWKDMQKFLLWQCRYHYGEYIHSGHFTNITMRIKETIKIQLRFHNFKAKYVTTNQ